MTHTDTTDPNELVGFEDYAEKCAQELRDQIRWEVRKGTKIWNEITQFSKAYCRENRDPAEVVYIFRFVNEKKFDY